ncbi:MAG: PLP-dependent aminotransferase family protein [Deltaproteobacteria bacterium]|nr:PLP-dependent aminotransferase family protein [Deltaproteobacteria bacterium]
MWSIDRPGRAGRGAGADAIYVRLAARLVADIRRGALRAGDRLPSTRALARDLAVNRNTVVAAFDELTAQGWIVSRGAAGSFVSAELPDRPVTRAKRAPAPPERPAFAMRAIASPTLANLFADDARTWLSQGVPDPRLVPTAMIARAYRRAMRSRAGRIALDYAAPHGAPQLRLAIAAMLRRERGLTCTADNVLVTRGSQQAIDLVARLLIARGDRVAVEELGYRPAWRAFEEAGARLVGVPLDDAGLVVAKLGAAPRALYVTPHHQYPTTVLMSPPRRMALLARAAADGFAILEDDFDHEFHFDGRPVAPLAAEDRAGSVVYIGTLSKVLAPGLRLGYAVGPRALVDELARLRAASDRQGDQVLELAVAELMDQGELARHARTVRRRYLARRDALVTALGRELPRALTFTLPPGGITLWARIADDIDPAAWQRAALARGLAVGIGRDFDLAARPLPFLRLGFARLDERELADGIRGLRLALDDRGVRT